MSYDTVLGDIIITVEIVEDEIQFDIVEDHIDIDLVEDSINVEIIQESLDVSINQDIINIDLVEDHIDVTLDDGCICPPSGGGGSPTEIYNCDGTLLIGDLVYPSSVINRYVLKSTDNKSENPVIGIVIKVLPFDKVEVSHLGFFNIQETLLMGHKVYVSSTGRFTSEVLDEGFVQVLGVAISETRVYLNPELRRCRRMEF
jgi:hypothetical protein